MNHLIDDLIEYARVARRENSVAPANVNTIVEKALDNLTFEIQDSDAVITVDPLPTVSANSTQLIQLFQNLVGNAIKYCNITPRIHISAEKRKGNGYSGSVTTVSALIQNNLIESFKYSSAYMLPMNTLVPASVWRYAKRLWRVLEDVSGWNRSLVRDRPSFLHSL